MRIPVISDTHGLLRTGVVAALADVPLILHAGDVGKDTVLDELHATGAPVHAIRGNVDRSGRVAALPETITVDIAGRRVHLVHDVHDLSIDPVTDAVDIVISGHSHKVCNDVIDGVLYLNPGSVGPRRFKLPITMAWLEFKVERLPEVQIEAFDP